MPITSAWFGEMTPVVIRNKMPGSADKICGWPGCTKPKDPTDGTFCLKHAAPAKDIRSQKNVVDTCLSPGCLNKPLVNGLCIGHHNKRETLNSELQSKDEPALRYDKGKIRYDLIPVDALEELAKVYSAGALKYEDRNWERGMSYSRCYGSLLRHIFAWWRGEEKDPETGRHHMAMAAWNAFALFCYETRGVGTDDRPKHKASSGV